MCHQKKNKLSEHTQCPLLRVIYFQIEARTIDFKYFQLSTCISNLASHSVWLNYRQFDCTQKNTGSFSTNRFTLARIRPVKAPEQIRHLLDYHRSFIHKTAEYFYFPGMSKLALKTCQPHFQLACRFLPRCKAAGV